ncbi:MAG: hypothetical protein QME63_10165 [Actinomycetota bacterium]|nr:hypothetical protein [Actinomycetota bacterium]
MHKKESKKAFGQADDYYRVRLLRVEEELPADLEWRDDILFIEPEYPGKLKVTYRLQLVTKDSREVFEIASVSNRKEAKKRYKEALDDLRDLSKMDFDEKYGVDSSALIEEGNKDFKGRPVIRVSSKELDLYKGAIIFTGEQRKDR